jgi:NAD(P)-dependent dehydrogenase (short-subunit alcohol dehydrogenase family)
MLNDYKNKAVVITGGTKGIGLATGLAFGRHGAHVYLTHAWASADEDEVRQKFADVGARPPAIVEADASREGDTESLLELVAKDHDGVEMFLSNVCVVQITRGFDDLSQRALNKSLEYSAWPMVAYLQQIKKRFGKYPRYTVGTSSDGPDHYYQGYELVALSKAVMEVFAQYLVRHLAPEGALINILRTRNVITESALAVHGQEYPDFMRKYGGESHFITCEQVADTILALCSGLLDAMNGQIVNVDKGGPFSDNLMRMYRQREQWGL